MSNTIAKLMAAALLAVVVPSFAGIALAAPIGGALLIKNAATSNIETVQWRGRGWGWGFGGGLATGAIIGGALAAPYYYGGGYYGGPYYYGGGPYYAAPAYEVEPGYYEEGGGGGGGVEYCMRRFRSYDPRSGTYMGYDGQRHPCP